MEFARILDVHDEVLEARLVVVLDEQGVARAPAENEFLVPPFAEVLHLAQDQLIRVADLLFGVGDQIAIDKVTGDAEQESERQGRLEKLEI